MVRFLDNRAEYGILSNRVKGRGDQISTFTATFTLWSNGTYSTGQALPHRKGEGKSRKNSKYLWLILRICTLVAQKVSAYGKDFRKAEG
jgi:hypothetical protein